MSAPAGPRIGLRASFESASMDFPELVEALRDMLSAKLVAYIGQVKETRAVAQWVTGDRLPSEGVQTRIRNTYLIAGTLLERDSKVLVQAWFQGMNPYLDDDSPARVMRNGDEDDWRRVLSAARAFASSSAA